MCRTRLFPGAIARQTAKGASVASAAVRVRIRLEYIQTLTGPGQKYVSHTIL